ncbi:helix-turn-helix domain-containing protein [Moheibacter stercoris]|uniref:Transcriptional regulator with XRE-family HTH domain n=1 Tax=Moheibacter stercoris TaxID=1628251 RepID=A0ABV2LV63_9FLAO
MSEILDFNKANLKEVKNSLAEWCQALRKENNETQISLAQKLNVSHKTIYNLEKGSNFTIDTLLKVLQYFDRLDLFYRFLSDQIAQEKDKKDISFY